MVIDTILPSGCSYIMDRVVKVIAGVTLTIQSGVDIESTHYEMFIYGTLRVEGTEDAPVKMHARANSSYWNGLLFYDSGAPGQSILNHLEIEKGKVRIPANNFPQMHDVVMDRSLLRISAISGDMQISNLYTIAAQVTASVGPSGTLSITNSTFLGGFYIHSLAGQVHISDSNLTTVEAGVIDLDNPGTIDMRHNWWGTADWDVINEHIRDCYDEPWRTCVQYLPIATEPIPGIP